MLVAMDETCRKVWKLETGKVSNQKVVALARKQNDHVILLELDLEYVHEHVIVVDLVIDQNQVLVETIKEVLHEK